MTKRTYLIFAVVVVLVGIFALVLLWPQPSVAPAVPGNSVPLTSYDNGDFSLKDTTNYLVDEHYTYSAFGPGKEISGIKFVIPAAIASGTNLSADSYLSVETIPGIEKACSADQFLDLQNEATAVMISENGKTYSFASSTGAGAGNRYEEWIYAVPSSSPCLAVRYFIHYGAIENYEPGTVMAFDKIALLKEFDSIRSSLRLIKQ